MRRQVQLRKEKEEEGKNLTTPREDRLSKKASKIERKLQRQWQMI